MSGNECEHCGGGSVLPSGRCDHCNLRPNEPGYGKNRTPAPKAVPLLTAAKNLVALIDEVPVDPRLGDETDRVFASWEFDELRAAIADAESPAASPT